MIYPVQRLLWCIKEKFFYSTVASLLTVVILSLVGLVLWHVADWALFNAVWKNDLEACRQASGACWGFVIEKWRLILFGRYPHELQWRPGLATIMVVAMLILSAIPALWTRRGFRCLMLGWVVALMIFFILMLGGVFGLSAISTDMWGGLPLTVVLTLFGMTLSVPLGVLLAIGRRSEMPIVSAISSGYIELVRGVPLITVLFVATFVFPLLMPEGVRVDSFWRVATAIVLFQAAYVAETVRGGLQTISRGQTLAALSLGMNKRQVYALVLLPQALVAVIPAFVNSLLSCFMDTSLVTVVSMYDLLGSLRLALGDAQWRGFFIEGYVFVTLIYFISSFLISRYSLWLEARLTGVKSRHHAVG